MLNVKKLLAKMLASDSGTITLPSGYTNHGAARNYYRRVGNVCTIGFDMTPGSSSSDAAICTLPAGCRPYETLRMSIAPMNWGSGSGNQYLIVSTNGAVTHTGNARVFGTWTFVCVGGVIPELIHRIRRALTAPERGWCAC